MTAIHDGRRWEYPVNKDSDKTEDKQAGPAQHPVQYFIQRLLDLSKSFIVLKQLLVAELSSGCVNKHIGQGPIGWSGSPPLPGHTQ